jgi:hypothetical protein
MDTSVISALNEDNNLFFTISAAGTNRHLPCRSEKTGHVRMHESNAQTATGNSNSKRLVRIECQFFPFNKENQFFKLPYYRVSLAGRSSFSYQSGTSISSGISSPSLDDSIPSSIARSIGCVTSEVRRSYSGSFTRVVIVLTSPPSWLID